MPTLVVEYVITAENSTKILTSCCNMFETLQKDFKINLEDIFSREKAFKKRSNISKSLTIFKSLSDTNYSNLRNKWLISVFFSVLKTENKKGKKIRSNIHANIFRHQRIILFRKYWIIAQ